MTLAEARRWAKRTEALTGLRILGVEDKVMVGMMLEDMLQDVGSNLDLAFSIEKARDGGVMAARAKMKEGRPRNSCGRAMP
jgi:hypothetical protein